MDIYQQKMEKKSFKKMMSVVPKKEDFDDVIRRVERHQKPPVFPKFKKSFRRHYAENVRYGRNRFLGKLNPFLNELPTVYNSDLLFQRFPPFHFILALDQLRCAVRVIDQIASGYIRLLKKDACDSLDQCKRLKVAALGCIYTVAMRCIPSLAYLDRVRQYMANLEDDENAAASTLTKKINQDVLAEERCTVPNHRFDVEKVDAADFVDPETMSWLWELERKHGFMLQDDEVDCNTWTQAQEAPVSAIGSIQALAI